MFKTFWPDEIACTLKERYDVLPVYCKEIWQVERHFATEKTSFERFDSQKTVSLRHVAIERNMPKVFCKRENDIGRIMSRYGSFCRQGAICSKRVAIRRSTLKADQKPATNWNDLSTPRHTRPRPRRCRVVDVAVCARPTRLLPHCYTTFHVKVQAVCAMD